MAENLIVWVEGKNSIPAAVLAKITLASNAGAVNQNSPASWCFEDEQN